MATDDEIKKIIENTLDERKKRTVAKVFRDPVKAEAICWLFGAAFVIILAGAIMFSHMGVSSFSSSFGNEDAKKFEKLVLTSSDCQTLKTLLHKITEEQNYGLSYTTDDFSSEIISRC